MEEVNAVAKKWGNSIGIILPNSIIQKQNINEGTIINVKITPQNNMTVGELMKLGKKIKKSRVKKSTEKIMKEIDKELWNEKW